MPCNTVSRDRDRFGKYDARSPSREKRPNSSAMSISTEEVISHNKGVGSAYRPVNSNSNCSSSSASAVSSHAAATNFGFVDGGKYRGEEGELNLWVQNLHLTKRKILVSASPKLVIAPDASLRGWGAFCQGQKTGGPWRALEKKYHINVLESYAVKYAVLTFTCMYPKGKSIHIQMDKIVALSYLVKLRGGTQNKTLITLSKENGGIYWSGRS